MDAEYFLDQNSLKVEISSIPFFSLLILSIVWHAEELLK